MSIIMKGNKNCVGRKLSQKTINKIREGNKGKFVSLKTRKKISIATQGRIPWNKGLTYASKSL